MLSHGATTIRDPNSWGGDHESSLGSMRPVGHLPLRQQPRQVPHVAVRGPGFRANVRISDGAVLACSLPPQVPARCERSSPSTTTPPSRRSRRRAPMPSPVLDDMLGRARPDEEVIDDDDQA